MNLILFRSFLFDSCLLSHRWVAVDSVCFFSSWVVSFIRSGLITLVCGTWFLSYRHTCTNTRHTVQWCLLALSQQPLRSCLVTTPYSKWKLFNSAGWKKTPTWNMVWLSAVTPPPSPFPSPAPLSPCTLWFLVLPIFSLEFLLKKKYKWTQTMERDGPDEARKTLMFIRQSLNRFHRCQSGKVTVTAPIRENGQYGNRRTDWKSALHNNISLTTDGYSREKN